ncbi:DUF805 domain-containing protein [Erythrobacter sp.]|uniref:DUF805 domain-containing protein n=1 Tax=Erythrobacter sp. TaxID=1042 RepID=UPI003120274F
MDNDPDTSIAEDLKQLAKYLFTFTGRTHRLDFFVWLVVMQHVSLQTQELASPFSYFAKIGIALLVVPALGRRLHDFNCSGWFALILPALIGLRIWGQFQHDVGLLPTSELVWPYNALFASFAIAIWVIALWPGTKGPNRFGPDPRVVESLAES